MKSFVLLDITGSIATLTLNRPERHNSLIPEMLEDLLEKLDSIQASPQVQAVILRANGRSFSTGGDVLEFYNQGREIAAYSEQLVSLLNQAILGIINLPVPVIAAVHGIVTGGSIGLVIASDIVLVTPDTSFTPYYGVVGFSPDGGWTALLPSLIGKKRAAETLLCNRTITAEEAVTWGLANRILPPDRIQAAALETASEIVKMVPGSVKSSKALLRLTYLDRLSILEEELVHFVNQVQSEEAHQGMADFLGIE